MSIADFSEQLSSELGCGRLTGTIDGGYWYLDLMGLLPILSVFIKSDANICRYYEIKLTQDVVQSFVSLKCAILLW